MRPAWTIAYPIPPAQFRDIRLRMIFDHHKWDSQFEDTETLGRCCLILEEAGWNQLRQQAERLWSEALAAEEEILGQPDLCRELGLGRRLWKACSRSATRVSSKGMVRVMRFDFHPVPEGWRISEANADVPGGFIEASAFAELACRCHPGTVCAPDAAEHYAQAVASALGQGARIALVHATAYTDDRQVMLFLAERFADVGLEAVLAGPTDLLWTEGRAELIGGRGTLDGIVRFFPAEWLPNIPARHTWERFFHGGRTPQSNPGYSLIVQSKRFPLVWDRLKTDLSTWRSLLPETRDPREAGVQNGEEWVWKPTLGRVGEGIGIRGVTGEKQWRQITYRATKHPREWVVQKRFTTQAAGADGANLYPCLGVFVIDGKACGIYGRGSSIPLIDSRAQDIPVLIRRGRSDSAVSVLGQPAQRFSENTRR